MNFYLTIRLRAKTYQSSKKNDINRDAFKIDEPIEKKHIFVSISMFLLLFGAFYFGWIINYSGPNIETHYGLIIEAQKGVKYISLAKVSLKSGDIILADCARKSRLENVVIEVKKGLLSGRVIYRCQ